MLYNDLLRVLLIIAVALSTNSAVAREWTTTDKTLAAVGLAATVVDWQQTLVTARNPERYRELNPMLKEHPTAHQVNRHFARGLLLSAAFVTMFPEYRTSYLGAMVALEVAVISRNHFYTGVRINF